MRKFVIIVCTLLIFYSGLNAQNILSPIWKISFKDTFITLVNTKTISSWNDVNLLLSWERQGFYSADGAGTIVNEFRVSKSILDKKMLLTISLQCDIKSIYINGKYIGGNLPNQFWSKRGAKHEFEIPDGLLKSGNKNRIAILINNLSYTGGISRNVCSISPKGIESKSLVDLQMDSPDHLYSIEKNNLFTIKYFAEQDGKLKLSIKNDFHQSFIQKEFSVKKGTGNLRVNFGEKITKPGFYECVAILNDGGYSSDVKWFTISPDKIKCDNKVVPHFAEFWNSTLAELKKVKPDFNIKKDDKLCTESRDGYTIEMKSLGGLVIRGYYFVPKTSGKHAAILHVPGYGDGYQNLGKFLSSKNDVIELALCVRGHGISADVFNPGFGIPGIWGYKLCSKTENAYRGIYMDCVRAIEFLVSRPEVDLTRIGVMGGSQGGGLTLATAGLCNDKIKACSFFDPFPCDTRDHLKIRTMCNREIKNFLQYYKDECSFEDALNVQDILDTKGFASMIKCPAFFVTSLFDDDAPSHMGFSAYNKIIAEKSFKIYPELGHLNDKAHDVQMQFLKNKLGF